MQGHTVQLETHGAIPPSPSPPRSLPVSHDSAPLTSSPSQLEISIPNIWEEMPLRVPFLEHGLSFQTPLGTDPAVSSLSFLHALHAGGLAVNTGETPLAPNVL